MLKRLLLGVLLLSSGATASAQSWHEHLDPGATDGTLRLGASHWELFRPSVCTSQLFDLSYLAKGLRADKPGFGLRFRSADVFTIDLRFDPITDSKDFVGPVYDQHIGATILSFAVNF